MDAALQSVLGRGAAFAHIARFHPELTAFRRDLHAHPELGFEEVPPYYHNPHAGAHYLKVDID